MRWRGVTAGKVRDVAVQNYLKVLQNFDRSHLEYQFSMASQAFADRPHNKLILFDVDETLTPARQVRVRACPEKEHH